ncbi:MAG: hypothetical protein JNM24_05285 [Bdellovibrionaceae bacterium]|nr:hypothetical protein [Pseudobdellovibrionaceae bacterium]
MNVQCQCGQVKAHIKNFPHQSPGRLVCYCDDCQSYLHYLKKNDLLDANGGTEIVPVYPVNFQFTQGQDLVRGIRLSPKGLYRWYASCCQTPIANTQAKMPWIGMLSSMLPYKSETERTQALGNVKSRVMGAFALGQPPADASSKFKPKDFLSVVPFILKGLVTGKNKNHPFFKLPSYEPKSAPYVLTLEERKTLLQKIYG